MTELDDIWAKMLEEAATKAGLTGRRHIADYLRLKAANDAIRREASNWLIETMIDLASGQRALKIERESPHNFANDSSNMVGARLTLRQGVRCLSVEAGWARTPSDGIMKCGALAVAYIRHFGLPRYDSELRLLRGDELPEWIADDDVLVDLEFLRRHIDLLLERPTV